MPAAYYRVGSYYVDTTTNKLYRCTTAGDKTSSIWALVAGGSNPTIEVYNNAHLYPVGSIVFILTTTTTGGITILPGTYVAAAAVPINGTGNQIPQYPLPLSGTIYWYAIAMGISVVNTCSGGGTAQVYINSSGMF